MNIVDKLTFCLEEERILPVSKETWNSFKLNHCFPESKQEKKEQYNYISEQVGNKSGIYIYMKDGDYLYIGKAKPLSNRIRNHYVESYKPIPDNCPKEKSRWDRFFAEYNGEVEIYWREFESEEERQLVEIILTKLLKPVFLTFK
ncbi:GIY-YIG nuclease family protein [Clostridium vincentii]|uniref:Excinuclease ABC subunit C n=1 Tax=Clostridium vincentii TaxID=52704 RepID=A0A2T0BL12_9CLOT|nr:GIY-YIG nuclease family protein [Clostridium vincentii]PRR84523.1 excinuclease ABC subunit C [Clostridium vincentii]